jgi:hypothetical protein
MVSCTSFIVLGLVDCDENPIKESNIINALDVSIKGSLLFNGRPSNFITYRFINVEWNEIASSHITLLFQFHMEGSYIVTLSCFIYRMKFISFCFHQFKQTPNHNVNFTSGPHLAHDYED